MATMGKMLGLGSGNLKVGIASFRVYGEGQNQCNRDN